MTPSLYSHLDLPASAEAALAALPPFLASWFRVRFDEPTPSQRLAWPALAEKGHLLVSAPTGMGKTLAVLVPILADLLGGATPAGWSDSPLRVVHIAPLRALVNDTARSLAGHLNDLADFLPPGVAPPRLAVRTGDTPAAERRQLRDEPPDILLTTPESLAVLLSQPGMERMLGNVGWVVVDEVHALVGTKRGADLTLCLERLDAIAAIPPRRVGLSATATPLHEAARWLVGVDRP
jgi:ATP-dependent Lhr-like helicase